MNSKNDTIRTKKNAFKWLFTHRSSRGNDLSLPSIKPEKLKVWHVQCQTCCSILKLEVLLSFMQKKRNNHIGGEIEIGVVTLVGMIL